MRDAKTSLKNEVLENATRFEFFEAARSLLLMTQEPPDGPGEATNPLLRFRSSATKNFPSGQIEKLDQSEGVMELYTHVIGLFGPSGVLPHPDRDMVAGGEPNVLMRDFLNIFNSRIITLFFHAWLANRYDVGLELHRRDVYGVEDAFSMILFSLCGMGLPSTRGQRLFSDDVFASSAGHISRPIRTASSIQRCLHAQFGVEIEVVEFVEEQLHLPVRIRSRIGSFQGAHNILGDSAIVGEFVPAFRQRFEVRIGPLDRDEFESLCPFDDESSDKISRNFRFKRLVEMTRSILGRPLDFDVRLTVKPEAVSPAKLGETRLGFDSWVCSERETNERADTLRRFRWDME